MIYATRSEGDAVGSDGKLKDASEIAWLHSPSDETPNTLPSLGANPLKQKADKDEDTDEAKIKKKKQSTADVSNSTGAVSGGESDDDAFEVRPCIHCINQFSNAY